jgi:ankyrin repeat protein
MLQEGFPADEADYDGRTGLMLACVNGHEGIARELLASGADPLRPDAMGTCALLEAVNNGRDAIISLLTRAGTRCSPLCPPLLLPPRVPLDAVVLLLTSAGGLGCPPVLLRRPTFRTPQ